MTTTIGFGYLDTPYLENPYLTGAKIIAGMQFLASIEDTKKVQGMQTLFSIENAKNVKGMQALLEIGDLLTQVGMQATLVITNGSSPNGMQATFDIAAIKNQTGMQALLQVLDAQLPGGMQAKLTINTSAAYGMQFEAFIDDFKSQLGMQFLGQISTSTPTGMEFVIKPNLHLHHDTYLNTPYLESPYLTENICVILGMQVNFDVKDVKNLTGMQFLGQIVDTKDTHGMQFQGDIKDFLDANGMQFEGAISLSDANGMQFLGQIIDAKDVNGMQYEGIISTTNPYGVQFNAQSTATFGMQFRVALYNITNLRILCDFPSRGLTEPSGGNNAWGDLDGKGLNWNASSTEPGDFEAFRLNTDFTEELWRSATGVVTGITLDNDSETAQGTEIDTMAILNHNLTQGATVSLIGSNSPTFATTDFITNIEVIPRNLYYLSPSLPLQGFRYWRININDSSNPAGFISIGTIIWGSSRVFQGECFVDQIEFQEQDFADVVATEGFTNVSNSRTQQRRLGLEFRFLDFEFGNFGILKEIFTGSRTTLKCLWIPTPHETRMRVVDRFAVFAKLSSIPTETHNNKGPDADYVSFSIDLDESN